MQLATIDMQAVMTSLEIAELLGSKHTAVKVSIDRLVDKGVISKPSLTNGIKGANGVAELLYIVSKRDSYVIVAQLSPEFTAALVDRWYKLEQQNTPVTMTSMEMVAAMANASVIQERRIAAQGIEIANIKQVVDSVNTRLTERLDNMAVDMRNGVPPGYISRSLARKHYGRGLSSDAFESALIYFCVKTHRYVHIEQGHSSSTFAWHEDGIVAAIDEFIARLVQTTPKSCYSPLTNSKLMFIKPV